jgi:hypothetical protein
MPSYPPATTFVRFLQEHDVGPECRAVVGSLVSLLLLRPRRGRAVVSLAQPGWQERGEQLVHACVGLVGELVARAWSTLHVHA